MAAFTRPASGAFARVADWLRSAFVALFALAALVAPPSAVAALPNVAELVQQLLHAKLQRNRANLPDYMVDADWPKQLPNNWIMGQVGGIAVDR